MDLRTDIKHKHMQDKEMILYPFTLEPVSEEQWWGTEQWLLADLGFRDSRVSSGLLEDSTLAEVMETYLDRVVGDEEYARTGRQFPVMAKLLRTRRRTPLAVCPDDIVAFERYDSLGKTKLWYVAKAEPGACIHVGLRRDMTATEFYESCLDASIIDHMNEIPVKKGDCCLIIPGMLHCAGPGLELVEISEASDLDLRLCNWGRTADNQDDAIFLEEAFDFIDMQASAPVMTGPDELAKIEQFTALHLAPESPVKVSGNGCFAVYICLKGALSIRVEADGQDGGRQVESLRLREGGIAVVPADREEYFLVPEEAGTELIELTGGCHIQEEEFVGEIED